MSLTVSEILAPEGIISRRLARYESRQEQLEMSQAVTEAIAERSHLAVEAGTGVGKSFAYLVPAILYACQEKPKEQSSPPSPQTPIPRAVVSTHTISLQ